MSNIEDLTKPLEGKRIKMGWEHDNPEPEPDYLPLPNMAKLERHMRELNRYINESLPTSFTLHRGPNTKAEQAAELLGVLPEWRKAEMILPDMRDVQEAAGKLPAQAVHAVTLSSVLVASPGSSNNLPVAKPVVVHSAVPNTQPQIPVTKTVQVTYENHTVSTSPTKTQIIGILNSADRIISNRRLMQDILDVSAINGSDPMDMMLTIAFETSGHNFKPTTYIRHGKKIRHSARGPFQLMPDQFVSLARQDGLRYAKLLRIYATTLSDDDRRSFISARADELETLSAYLSAKHPGKNYKHTVAHDPIAARMIKKAYTDDYFIGMVLQDGSNMHDIDGLRHFLKHKFNMSPEQARNFIGSHIEEHLVNFLGPSMGKKISALRAAGKGNLPVFPAIFAKEYMAAQNAACKVDRIEVTITTKQVPIVAKKHRPKKASASQKAKKPDVKSKSGTKVKTFMKPKPAAKGKPVSMSKPVVKTRPVLRVRPAVTGNPTPHKAVTVKPQAARGHVSKPTILRTHPSAPVVKPKPAQKFRTVTRKHIIHSCQQYMSVQNYYDKQMTLFGNLYPTLENKVLTDIRLNPSLSYQFRLATIHRQQFLALAGNAAPRVAQITTQTAPPPKTAAETARRSAPPAQPQQQGTGWYDTARQVFGYIFGAASPPQQQRPTRGASPAI